MVLSIYGGWGNILVWAGEIVCTVGGYRIWKLSNKYELCLTEIADVVSI